MYSSLTFNRTIECLKLENITVVSTQRIDACNSICTAHLYHKTHHFQLIYLKGILYLIHRDYGKAKFLTVAHMVLGMNQLAAGCADSFNKQIMISADVWKGVQSDTVEIRFNMNHCLVANHSALWGILNTILAKLECELGPITTKQQAIVIIPTKKFNMVKLGFLTHRLNPVYEWRNHSQ